MTTLPIPPDGANPPDPPALYWSDPAAARTWLMQLRSQIDDALAAARDATHRRKKRVLSRAEARRKLNESAKSLFALLESANRALSEQP